MSVSYLFMSKAVLENYGFKPVNSMDWLMLNS